jgi:hypothetical protein
MTRSVEEILHDYAERFDWESTEVAEALVAYLGESVIDPLLVFIQEVGLTEDFEEFLADNWPDEPPETPDDQDLEAAGGGPAEADLEQLVRELTESRLPSQVDGQTHWRREGF